MYVFFDEQHYNKDEYDNIYFMNTRNEFMKSTQLLGVHISNDITNRNITSSVYKYIC